ncbi:MAG: tetratricopeptide repeat protein, partial [Betaproteobacteria bacterium]|nr:tetratricopeptide repeat protein [Betaproteobacteria bacterium]
EARAIAGEHQAESATRVAESERDNARRAGTLAQSEARRAVNAEAKALLEAQQAGAVRDFLVALFTDMDHAQQGARQLSAYDLLEQGRTRADKELASQPKLHATILMILARVYERTGDLRQAKNLFQATVEVERKLGTRPLIEADALMHLALVQANDRAHAAAEGPARASLALRLKHAGADALVTAESHSTLALTLSGLQRHAEAREHMQKALTIRETILGPKDAEVAFALHNLGQIQAQAGQYEDGIASYRRSIDIKRVALRPNHPSVAGSIEGLGQTLRRAGRLAEAEPHLTEAYKLQREINGPESGRFASAADSLGNLLHDMGRFAEARRYYQEAVSALEKSPQNATSVRAALYLNNLASAHDDLCEYDTAQRHYQKSIEIRKIHLKREDPGVLRAENNLGRSLNRAGKLLEARMALQPVLEIRAKSLPVDHVDLIDTRIALLESEIGLGQRERAAAGWSVLSPIEPSLTGARKFEFQRVAALFRAMNGDAPGAQRLLKSRWDAMAGAQGATHVSTLRAQLDYAEALARSAPDEAARIATPLRESLALRAPQACGVKARVERLAQAAK